MSSGISLQTVVVGIDFSAPSEVAAQVAATVARHAGARKIYLVHVALRPLFDLQGHGYYHPLPAGDRDPEARRREELEGSRRLLEALRAGLAAPGIEIDTQVIEDDADVGLCRFASEVGADLVAIGSHGRGGLSRFLLGSAAERVIRRCDRTVLVARGEASSAGFQRILVPVDFTPFSEEALDTALLVAAPGARVDLLHCWELPVGAVLRHGAPTASRREVEAFRAEVERRAAAAGEALLAPRRRAEIELHFESREGAPSRGILSRIEEEGGYDLVAMGSHGRRGFRRFLIGSVAETVVRYAPCSVAVVRGAGGRHR